MFVTHILFDRFVTFLVGRWCCIQVSVALLERWDRNVGGQTKNDPSRREETHHANSQHMTKFTLDRYIYIDCDERVVYVYNIYIDNITTFSHSHVA